MVHVGSDLSRTRPDVHVVDEAGAPSAAAATVPDGGGLAALTCQIKGRVPLACKNDKIDAWLLAELSRRDRVPIWLPTLAMRAERERARWRLHLTGAFVLDRVVIRAPISG